MANKALENDLRLAMELHKVWAGRSNAEILRVCLAAACTAAKSSGLSKGNLLEFVAMMWDGNGYRSPTEEVQAENRRVAEPNDSPT